MRNKYVKSRNVEKMHRGLGKSDEGVVGIVVAVLLIGLLVAVVSLVQVYYVPSWMKQREADHMDEVETQFSQLKYAIDTHAANKEEFTPISTSITLGTQELPFLMSMRSFGDLKILKNAIKITITNSTNSTTYDLGAIKYSSSNAYLTVDPAYVYETGAVITDQREGNILKIKPSFYTDDTGSTIFFRIVNISGVGGKIAWSGYDSIPILTEFYNSSTVPIWDVRYITITTSYLNAWYDFLDSTLNKKLSPDDPDKFDIIVNDNQLSITFDVSFSPMVEITYVEILAQIGPGFVE